MIKCWIKEGSVTKIHPLVHGEQLQEGFFVTPEELEQVQREAFRAARIVDGTVTNYYRFETEDDYLSSKSKEGK